jgi:hypothetical protein
LEAAIDSSSGSRVEAAIKIRFYAWMAARRTDPKNRDLYDPKTLTRPSFQVLTPPTDATGSADVAGYFQRTIAGEWDRWHAGWPEFTVAAIRRTGDSQTGIRYELALPNGGSGQGDVVVRGEKHCDGSKMTFDNSGKRGFSFLVNLQYEHWSNSRAYGGSGVFLFPFQKRDRYLSDSYFGLEAGGLRYDSGALETSRAILGLRYGIGLGIVFLDLGLQRAHRFETDEQLVRAWNLSVGARIQLPF